jgi:hypothetical protein
VCCSSATFLPRAAEAAQAVVVAVLPGDPSSTVSSIILPTPEIPDDGEPVVELLAPVAIAEEL